MNNKTWLREWPSIKYVCFANGIVCSLCSHLVKKKKPWTCTMTTKSRRVFDSFKEARLWLQSCHNVHFMVGNVPLVCLNGFLSVHFHSSHFLRRSWSLRFQPLTSAVMSHGAQSPASPSGKQQHDLTALIIMWKPHSQMSVCRTDGSSWK